MAAIVSFLNRSLSYGQVPEVELNPEQLDRSSHKESI